MSDAFRRFVGGGKIKDLIKQYKKYKEWVAGFNRLHKERPERHIQVSFKGFMNWSMDWSMEEEGEAYGDFLKWLKIDEVDEESNVVASWCVECFKRTRYEKERAVFIYRGRSLCELHLRELYEED